MKVQKMSRKVLEKTVDQVFKTYCHGVQFDIFDVGKVLDAIRQAVVAHNSAADAFDVSTASDAGDENVDKTEDLRIQSEITEMKILSAIALYRKN